MNKRLPKGWKEELLTNLATARRGTEPGSATYCGTEEGVRFLRVGDLSGKTNNPVFANAKRLLCIESNDRFYIIDKDQVLTLGASLNKAGQRATFLSNIKADSETHKITDDFDNWWNSATLISF